MLAGAGLAHRLNAAASGTGVSLNGQIAVIASLVAITMIGFIYRKQTAVAGQTAEQASA